MKEGWEIKKLGDVCDVLDSKRKPITKRNRIEGEIPYYGATGVLSYVRDYIFDERLVLLGEDGAKWESGDNSAFIISGKTWVNNHAHVLRPYREILKDKWLVYNLNFQDLMPFVSGMTVPKLNQGNMYRIPIPIPRIEEQKQIVSILDKAFKAIDQAKANVERNLQNAKELFESYLNGVFENKGEGWEKAELSEIVDPRCSLSYGIVQPGEEYANGLPVIRPTDMKKRFVQLKGLKLIDPVKAESYKRTNLVGDELLICVRGETGIISLITDELKGANVTRGIVPICFDSNKLSIQFGYYLFSSLLVQKQIKDKTYGAALMQINIRDLRKLLMVIPPYKEQQSIVQKLNALSAETKNSETIYQQKIEDLEELKKSILQKAFTGKLTEKEIIS